MVQSARLLHAIPEARRAAHAGVLGVAQSRLLAKVFANRRCADQLPASGELLVGHAHSLWYDEFAVVVRRWEALADADGAHGAHERAHSGRDAHVSIVDQRVYLDARGGVPAGVVIEEIFERFCRAEFDTDWDAGQATWGERMNPSLLDRSAAQRRFDALLAIFTAAAGSGAIGRVDPLVNIIVDHATFDHHLARLAGADPDPIDPATVDERRCETSTGVQLDPDDMLAAALTGHVRRVVFDTAGVVIDLGRRSRLFTGHSRDAVLLGDRWCLWPGCDQRSGRCQTDHTQPWAGNGPTSPDNAGPGLRPPQPMETPTRLHHMARPHRTVAHLPTRRHRNRPPHQPNRQRNPNPPIRILQRLSRPRSDTGDLGVIGRATTVPGAILVGVEGVVIVRTFASIHARWARVVAVAFGVAALESATWCRGADGRRSPNRAPRHLSRTSHQATEHQ